MDLKTLVSLAGILGFVFSIAVFILTRWERRKRIVIELESGEASRFIPDEDVIGEDTSVLILRATNIGGAPVIVDRDSFAINGRGKTVSRHKCDWLGIENVPSPLAPHSSFEVAIFKESLEILLQIQELQPYMNTEEYGKTVIPITATFKEFGGKSFTSKGYSYNFYVNEVTRS